MPSILCSVYEHVDWSVNVYWLKGGVAKPASHVLPCCRQ
jgi:hypothetical protein